MHLALADIWVEKKQNDFFVKLRDGQVCDVLGPMDERSAHKIHAQLIDAVFGACLEQTGRLQGRRARPAAANERLCLRLPLGSAN